MQKSITYNRFQGIVYSFTNILILHTRFYFCCKGVKANKQITYAFVYFVVGYHNIAW